MQATAVEQPWYQSILDFGGAIADRAGEYASIKLEQEMARHRAKTEELRNREASTNKDLQDSLAPVKGKDADGATLTETVNFAGQSFNKSTLKTAGFVLGGVLLAGLAYKAVS